MRCASCGSALAGRGDARYCSTRCRVAASRRRPPRELTERRRWIRHNAAKVPVGPGGRAISAFDDYAHLPYEEAAIAPYGSGTGFVLWAEGIACLDLDGALVDGRVEPWARSILRDVRETYVEVSLSGRGLHVFGFGVVGPGRKIGPVELYDRSRYIAVTGRRYSSYPSRLADIQPVIDRILAA